MYILLFIEIPLALNISLCMISVIILGVASVLLYLKLRPRTQLRYSNILFVFKSIPLTASEHYIDHFKRRHSNDKILLNSWKLNDFFFKEVDIIANFILAQLFITSITHSLSVGSLQFSTTRPWNMTVTFPHLLITNSVNTLKVVGSETK